MSQMYISWNIGFRLFIYFLSEGGTVIMNSLFVNVEFNTKVIISVENRPRWCIDVVLHSSLKIDGLLTKGTTFHRKGQIPTASFWRTQKELVERKYANRWAGWPKHNRVHYALNLCPWVLALQFLLKILA